MFTEFLLVVDRSKQAIPTFSVWEVCSPLLSRARIGNQAL